MFLVRFDELNTVISIAPLNDPIKLPLNIPLDASYMIMGGVPGVVGQTFDPITGVFQPAAKPRWITTLAFDNRFTTAEAVGLKIAQEYPPRLVDELEADYRARCNLPAQLRVMSERRSLANYIDLARADTRAGVQQLEALGFLAVGRALEILDTPVADHEYTKEA